jgi:hypothetical protein
VSAFLQHDSSSIGASSHEFSGPERTLACPCDSAKKKSTASIKQQLVYTPVPRKTTSAVRTRIFKSSQKLQFST